MIPRITTTVTLALTVLLTGLLVACTAPQTEDTAPQAGTESAALPPSRSLPPSEAQALAALESSPRHGEWVDIDLPGSEQPLRTWVVYPERADPAPAVLMIQEIYGMTDWIRGVADQLAADGFIAIAPDLLSGKGPGGGGTESAGSRDAVVALVRSLTPEETVSRLNAAREYARGLPAASGTIAALGFCWGGGASFAMQSRSQASMRPSSTMERHRAIWTPTPKSTRRCWAYTAAMTPGSTPRFRPRKVRWPGSEKPMSPTSMRTPATGFSVLRRIATGPT